MTRLTTAVMCALAALVCFTNRSFAKSGWNKCLGQPIETPELKSANETCLTEFQDVLGLTTPTPTRKQIKKAWKNYCFRICHLEKLGLVTEGPDFEIALSPKRLSAFVHATYPASLRINLMDGIMGCANRTTIGNSKKTPDPNDKKCKYNKPLVKCIDQLLKKSCKQNTDAGSNNIAPSSAPILTSTSSPSTPRSSKVQAEGASVIDISSTVAEEDQEDDDDDEDDY